MTEKRSGKTLAEQTKSQKGCRALATDVKNELHFVGDMALAVGKITPKRTTGSES